MRTSNMTSPVDMLPDELQSKEREQTSPIVLIIPPGVKAPQDFPLKIVTFSEKHDLILAAAEAVTTEAAIVLEVPGEFASIMIQLARYSDSELRALVGFEGDYPAYWNASTSVLPIAVASELMSARDNSEAVGGTGVQESKKDKPPFKPVDDDAVARRMAMIEDANRTAVAPEDAASSEDE